MIISVSRRTDIPAFFSTWFMNRIRDGYCTVFNPFNRKQVKKISLQPRDVDVLVFWTKNPKPLIPYLEELDQRGYRYFFQYTLNGYPTEIEPYVPDLETGINTFLELAAKIGPEKLIWRYDPIIISDKTGYEYHKNIFHKIAQSLRNSTNRVVISIVDSYRKAWFNLKKLSKEQIHITQEFNHADLEDLIKSFVDTATQNGQRIYSCAEIIDLSPFGVLPGKCIDDQYIKQVFGIDVSQTKDKFQRPECGCVQSKDIGAYDTCLHGCIYCYAGTLQSGLRNHKNHYPDSSLLVGRYEVRTDELLSR